MKTFQVELNKKKAEYRYVYASNFRTDGGYLTFYNNGDIVTVFATGTWLLVKESPPTTGTINIGENPSIVWSSSTGKTSTPNFGLSQFSNTTGGNY